MKIFSCLCVSCLLAGASFSHPALAQTNAQTGHTAAIEQLKAYRFGGDQAVLNTVSQWVNQSRANPDLRSQAARELAEVLKSNASFDAKQFVCRELVLIAGEEQVPALAGLLGDEVLAHYALLVLSRIPGKTVDEALRKELPRSRGKAQLEIIDALGQRRDAEAVPLLSPHLQSTDAATLETAATALGKIGDARAVQALRQSYEGSTGNRSFFLGRALLVDADGLRTRGDVTSAQNVYDLLGRNAANSELSTAALRGIVQLRGQNALPLLLGAIEKDGTPLQAMAISLAHEVPGPVATKSLAERLPKLGAPGQLLLVAALSDRGDQAAVPAISPLVRSANAEVRTAALNALGAIGDASTVPVLLEFASTGEKTQREAARASLAKLRGQGVDNKLIAMLNQAQPPIRVEIIGSLGERRVTTAVPRLVQEVRSPQAAVSSAAVRVLRDMGRPADVPTLLGLLSITAENRRAEVIDAVAEIARRGTDENERTGAILQRLAKATAPADKVELLSVLGRVGGPRALETLRKSATDAVPEVRMSSLRLLASWPTTEPMGDLLNTVRTAREEAPRIVALRGYIRMIGMNEQQSPEETLALYRQANAASKNTEVKRLVLAGLAKLKSLESLDYASGFLTDNDVRAEAELAVVEIGRSTIGASRDKTRAVLEPLATGSTNQNVSSRAREVLALSDKFGDFVMAWEVSPAYTRDGANSQQLFDIAFAPEEAGQKVLWRLLPVGGSPEQPWLLDLLGMWGGEQRVAYLRTAVWSQIAREVVLELGSDDGIKVWWNGQVAHANNTQRAVAPGQEKVKLQIKEGWNQLMLKVTQNNMGWGASARFTDLGGTPAIGLRYVVPSGMGIATIAEAIRSGNYSGGD